MSIDVYPLVRKKFPAAEFALMEEVSDAAGFARSGSTDFIAVGLWPSRGLHVHGIELKSFRSDWLRELKNPRKQENIFCHCHFFWLLTTDVAIANIEEIPAKWGWLSIRGGKIVVIKEAPLQQPIPLTHSILAAMLKRASNKDGYVRKEDIQEKIDGARESEKANLERTIERFKKELNDLRAEVTKFEQAAGISIRFNSWSNDRQKIGDAIRALLNGDAPEIVTRLRRIDAQVDEIKAQLRISVTALSDLAPKIPEKQ